ncbi:MAG: histidine--tRNA ligase [Candidatus Yanofskybacteria bacterium]|nr:histidine--tRNA ligase [Candidatus Yanofskybacteria bacterium]
MAKLKSVQSVRGMHDILPEDQTHWKFVYKKASVLLDDYGFGKIDTPIVESSGLFLRSVGEETDIVSKEMYSFKTRGGDELSLRPENTVGVARAYIEHGMSSWPHPVKLWYWGPMFRHDQPQAGRYRQFYQFGTEIFGDDNPAADAESIFVALTFLESLGFKNLTLKINSLGDSNCRPRYLKVLKEFLKSKTKQLCAPCKIRVKENILRVLDCKEESCQNVIKEAPQMIDHLDENCRSHFKKVIEFLDEVKAPYMLDPFLVRGLDYYSHTVFEIVLDETAKTVVPENEKTASGEAVFKGLTLVGGGRYDGLVSLLGGAKTPAVGWSAGIERIILAMKTLGLKVPDTKQQPRIFLAQLGDFAKRKSLVLFEDFRKAGISASTSLGRDSIKAQLRIANRLRVKFAVIIGHKEALDKTAILREMDSGIQEIIPMDSIIESVKKRLKG